MAEYSYNKETVTTFFLEVKYTNDTDFYNGFVPVENLITDDGLNDPGFNSGPKCYEEIEIIRVLSKPPSGSNKDYIINYNKNYSGFCNKIKAFSKVKVYESYVEWNKNT